MNVCPFECIPDDCVGVIFTNFRQNHLEIAAGVCRRWRARVYAQDPVVHYYNDCVPSAWLVFGGDFMTLWLADGAYVLYKRGGFICLVAVFDGGVAKLRENPSGVPPRLLRKIVRGLNENN